MNVEHIHHYSHHLDREMNIRVYGHDGLPLVAFPCQNGDCDNYEVTAFWIILLILLKAALFSCMW